MSFHFNQGGAGVVEEDRERQPEQKIVITIPVSHPRPSPQPPPPAQRAGEEIRGGCRYMNRPSVLLMSRSSSSGALLPLLLPPARWNPIYIISCCKLALLLEGNETNIYKSV